MKKFSKLKIGIGLAYLSIVTLVVVLFFYYGANSFLDLEFLKNNKERIFNFRDQNFVLLSVIYFLIAIIWVFLMGFGLPLVIIAGDILVVGNSSSPNRLMALRLVAPDVETMSV